jgi:hypothetical protein
LITALKGQATNVLHDIPTSPTYEEILQALENRFGDQHFAAAYCCQLTRTQRARDSLQDSAVAVEQLAHRAYPTLHEDHICVCIGVEDPNIKIQVLGEKTVNKALRQAFELQAIFLAARPHKNSTKTC